MVGEAGFFRREAFNGKRKDSRTRNREEILLFRTENGFK